jgi:tRNA:m4X modification enzyme
LEKLFHPCCDVLFAEKKAQGASKTSLRHIEQQASILAHMEKLDLLHKGVTYIEMGAGRGMLSLALAQKFQQVINHQERVEIQSGISYPDANSLSYILIDRAGSRGKADHLLSLSSKESRTRPQQHTFRAKIDIRHLNFGAMSEAVNRSVVCMSKHLCGVATDLSLRCISTTLPPVVPNQISPHVKGIAIALCCHHVCTLEDYISPEFFLSQGFQPQEFALLTGMTSWATCGMNGAEAEEGDSVERALGINREDRIILGRKCKRILDTGRLLYIRSHQLQARLVHYCEEQDSLENCLLLAWRAKSV